MRPQTNVTTLATLAMALTVIFMIPVGVFTPSAYADSVEAKARALQNGISLDTTTEGTVGSDIDCVGGVDTDGGADNAICYLVPDGVPTPDYATDPSVISQAMSATTCPEDAGFTGDEECFSTTFDESNFTPGHWRFVVEFYNGQELVDLAGNDFRVHSFGVIPETPIGMIAIVGAALAGLGGFYLLRGRQSVRQDVSTSI